MTFKTTSSVLILAALVLSGCENSSDVKKGDTQSHNKNPCLTKIPAPIALTGGPVSIGSNDAYPEERPQRNVNIEPFEIDATEIINRQFAAFVKETGYVTDAEKPQPGFDVPGGAVFTKPTAKHPSGWKFVEGAHWRKPEGTDHKIDGWELAPVVQVTVNDAKAYARWAERRLPTDVEWEYAAKAGATTFYPWGDEKSPNGEEKANTWQGAFPIKNKATDGYGSLAPVGCFDPNAFGLYDMIGNVWELTDTAWDAGQSSVIKGGSFLCAENYCRRYRASAKQPQENNFSTNHVGFRTVKSITE